MKRFCAVFALILFFSYISIVSAESEMKVIGKDGTVQKDRIEKTKHQYSDNESMNTSSNSTVNTTQPKSNMDSSIKAAQTAFENALTGFSHLIINQLMAGSIDISASEAEKNSTSSSVTYTIKYRTIDPYEPVYVRNVLKNTFGYIICLLLFVNIGSFLMVLAQEYFPDTFSDIRESWTGENGLYTTRTMRMATLVSVGSVIFSIIAIFIITGFRNLIVYSITPTGVTIPNLNTDSIPNGFLIGFSAYTSALESHLGLYGINVMCAMVLIFAGVCSFIGMLGATDKVVKIVKLYWGAYALWNFIDIINVCCISAGIYQYIETGDDFYVSVGIMASAVVILILIRLLIYQLMQTVKTKAVVIWKR